MKLLNELRDQLQFQDFDLEHESNMVQSRLLSPILEVIEEKGLTQSQLAIKTGLKQPFISAIFNVRKKLSMEHIALLQNALGIVMQPPEYLSEHQHINKFYSKSDYQESDSESFSRMRKSCIPKHLHLTNYTNKEKNYISTYFYYSAESLEEKDSASKENIFENLICQYR